VDGMNRRVAIGVGVLVLALLAGCGWLLIRDSGFVRVHKVEIVGLSGVRAQRLRAAALSQTTMNVDEHRLRVAAAGQPPIDSLDVQTEFPDRMKIRVRLFIAAASVVNRGSSGVAVASDGTVLQGVSTAGLATVEGIAGAGRVRTPSALLAISVLAEAPGSLRGRLDRAGVDKSRGIVVVMRSGPKLYFGSNQDLKAKWAAVSRVLADPATAGASYVDVSVPRRPAVGGLQGAVQGGIDPADPNQPVAPDGATGDTQSAGTGM